MYLPGRSFAEWSCFWSGPRWNRCMERLNANSAHTPASVDWLRCPRFAVCLRHWWRRTVCHRVRIPTLAARARNVPWLQCVCGGKLEFRNRPVNRRTNCGTRRIQSELESTCWGEQHNENLLWIVWKGYLSSVILGRLRREWVGSMDWEDSLQKYGPFGNCHWYWQQQHTKTTRIPVLSLGICSGQIVDPSYNSFLIRCLSLGWDIKVVDYWSN